MRRRFFLFAAPAIVAAPSLMRVSAAVLDELWMDWGKPSFPPDPNFGIGQLITETLRNRSHYFAEQITKSNAIARYLASRNLLVEHMLKRDGIPSLVTNS